MKKSINLSTGVEGLDVQNAIRNEYNVSAIPKITFDWNLNRYTTPVTDNTPAETTNGFSVEAYPIESIVEPLRPSGKGMIKAKVGQATVSPGYVPSQEPRYYVSDEDDVYKYWCSPYVTNASGVFPNHTDGITSARPRVEYDRVVQANKIVIRTENTWATPKTHSVMLAKTKGGSYSAIGGTNPAIDAKTGTLTLYFNGTAWVSTRPSTLVLTDVAAIEFRVSAMGPGSKRSGATTTYRKKAATNTPGWGTQYPTDGSASSLNVIAIEAHIEADLTDRLVNVSDTFDMGEPSDLYPIGTITSNVGTITLSNEDGIFNKENGLSPFYGLIDANVEVNLEYRYNINGTIHSVQQFKMYTSTWSDDEEEVTVELEDYSKYLKESKPNPFMIEGKTTPEIVWRVLDSVGFVDYEIQEDDLVENPTIPIFWTTGEETVWEVLDSIAKASQTAIYIDGRGKLQVRTREAAFRDKAPIDWSLLGVKSGSQLPDIMSWSPSGEYEANKISVKYKNTKWKVNSLGFDALSKVWEPESDTLVVRSSQLTRAIDGTSTHIFLDQKEAAFWPYRSKVQIDGEIIQYDGKQFVYYTYTETTNAQGQKTWSNPVKRTVNVLSADEYKTYQDKTPQDYQFQNYFTGGLKISERSVWNTDRVPHPIDINGWTTKSELRAGNSAVQITNPKGFQHNKKESTVTINTPPNLKDGNDTFWAHRGTTGSTGYRVYGTRFKFNADAGSPTQVAGIAYQMAGVRENGYYVEFRQTSSLTAASRSSFNEVSITSRVGGKDVIIGKGTPLAVAAGVWYDVDIYHSTTTGNTQRITVWVNGQLVASATTTAKTALGDSGRFGFFARGKTNIDFEYIYAIARPANDPIDGYGFFDLKYGGIRGGQWEREWVWEMRTRWKKISKKKSVKESYRHNLYVFDEFGPYIHEVREFDVKFDPSPVRFSYLFNTNNWFAAVPEYTSSPFGAKFIITNTSRDNAILNGEDNLIYAGAGSAVNQACVVLGQDLDISDEEVVEKKNEQAIRARGTVESELSSDWIQTKESAELLANWMRNHWSNYVDQVEVEIFGNPLLELGDIVDVNYPRKNCAPSTHKYFIVGINTSFDAGVKTNLTLRRRRYVS